MLVSRFTDKLVAGVCVFIENNYNKNTMVSA